MLQILSCRMDLAARYGTDAAIFLNNIVYWTTPNEAEGRYFRDGRYWMHASLNGFARLYPIWSVSQIKRIIAKLREAGALIVGDYNEDRMDRTKWYSPSDEILALYAVDKSVFCIGRNRKMHLTESSQDGTKSENVYNDEVEKKVEKNIPPISPKRLDAEASQKLFERFWKAYPRKQKKQDAKKAWDKLAPDLDLCRVMAVALEAQKRSAQWTRDGGEYIPYPSSWLRGRRWEDEIHIPVPPGEDYNEEGHDGI